MGAFVKTTKVCAVAALGLGLSLGIAVSADPSAAIAAAAPASQATSSSIIVTSPTEIDEKTPVEIAGTARPGSTLQVFGLPGEFVTPVEVSDDGTFSHRSERGFVAGVHTVTVSSGYLDSVVLDMRVRGTDGAVPALIPLTVDEPTYVPGQRLVLSGRATPGASILVTAPSASLGSTDVTVRDDGTWSFVSTLPVRGTEHEVKVRQSGPAGTDYKIFTITADEPSFKPLTVDAPSYVPGQKVRLSGTATPNGAINILGNSAGISENITAGDDGKWSF
ncbi:hypothetical protein, partial [Curtobacterium sp. MCBA15_016]|uniref:hypothetical protein n=1 Tax=Curtobacterium sp. MCBA15_016 TaxID=1898740 RepID=UPI0011139B44